MTGYTSPHPTLHVSDISLFDSDEMTLTGELMRNNLGSIVSVNLNRVRNPQEVIQYLPQCPNLSAFGITDSTNCDQLVSIIPREKGRDLTQSYDKSPYTNRNVKRAK